MRRVFYVLLGSQKQLPSSLPDFVHESSSQKEASELQKPDVIGVQKKTPGEKLAQEQVHP